MRKKIFKNMCLLALVTILLSSLLVTIVYYANSDARMKSEVREETRFVRGAVELSGQDYLATVENTANRITLIDTAGTLCHAAEALIKIGGAKEVYACASHGVLSGPAIQRLEESPIKKLTLLDTIPLPAEKRSDKIELLQVAPVFTEAIARIYEESSVSPLFD